jgi:hypothetical protein
MRPAGVHFVFFPYPPQLVGQMLLVGGALVTRLI